MRGTVWLIPVFMGFLCLFAPSPVFADELYYLEMQNLPPTLLPPPPVEGSKEWKTQIDQTVHAQHHLAAVEIKALRDEQHVQVEMMTGMLGAAFTREHLPTVFALLDRVLNDAEQIVSADKFFYHTRRPYLTDAQIKLYVDRIDNSPSYPSGHTADSRVLAEVLGLLLPQKIDALRARADKIAWHRVEAGVHYPIDLEGGRSLALLIVGALSENEDFQDDLANARAEMTGTLVD